MLNGINSINFQGNQYKPAFKSGDNPRVQNISEPVIEYVKTPTLLSYMANMAAANVEASFFNSLSVKEMMEKYGVPARACVKELSQRAGKDGQELNWIGVLPKTQLQRLDEIYMLADSLKQNGGGKLGIIGIGGSKHTIENLLSLTGLSDKAVFLSAVDPDSISDFIKKLGDKKTASVIVASKSGTTLEPSVGFEQVRKILGDDFKNYVCITDKDASKSKLRKLADEKGYKCGIIHDGCGGRFGAFDDHTLTALAYCGMTKEDMKKMLETSLKAQEKFLSPDINKNTALQRAIFNTDSVMKGRNNQYDYYFSDRFNGTLLWNTQMKKESNKSLYNVSGDLIGPAFLHNSTEADLDKGNNSAFYTFNTVKNSSTPDYKAYNALIKGSLKAYSDRHPVSLVEIKNFSPESIGEFVELKHFEAMYTGMLLRNAKNIETKDVLPEVTQPNVKIYKDEVQKLLRA